MNLDDSENYREVVAWVHGPKLDGPTLREQTGRFAHKNCVEKLIEGQAPDQPEFDIEDAISEVLATGKTTFVTDDLTVDIDFTRKDSDDSGMSL